MTVRTLESEALTPGESGTRKQVEPARGSELACLLTVPAVVRAGLLLQPHQTVRFGPAPQWSDKGQAGAGRARVSVLVDSG